MKQKKWILTFFMLTAMIPVYAGNSFNFDAAVDGYFTDNIFMNRSEINDYVSHLLADINLPLKRLNLFLEASVDLFRENPGFNSFQLEPGFQYFHPLKGRNSLLLGLSYKLLKYNELYTDFNFSGPELEAGIKLYTGQKTILQSGYRFQSRNYNNYRSFDFSNHNGYVELRHFFRSQTTVMVEAGFNYRYYPHIAAQYDFGEGFRYYEGNGQHGHGGGMGSGGGMSGGGMGGGNTGNQPPGSGGGITLYNQVEVPNVYVSLGLKQAIGTKMAIVVETEWRNQLKELNYEQAESMIKNAYVLYHNNDDFLWDGLRMSLTARAVLLKKINMQASVSYYYKDYPGILILDEEGNILEPALQRNDKLFLYTVEASKEWGRFTINVNFIYRDNRSNDDYFHYQMISIAAGMAVGF